MPKQLWDGKEPLQAGMWVRYEGTQDSSFYKLPLTGEPIQLIAEDINGGHNPVWIVRWYDGDLRILLVPLLPKVFGVLLAPDPRVAGIAKQYHSVTGEILDEEVLEECLAFLLKPGENAPPEPDDYLEVTLLNDGSFSAFKNVAFPVTLRLRSDDYRLSSHGIYIKPEILQLLPGANIDNRDDYLFYPESEAIYEEIK